MEHINYSAFAIPAFFLFLYIEYAVAKIKNKQHFFKYESSIANLSIGIAERLLNLFISVSFFNLFNFVYKNYALFKIPNTWWVWVLLILVTDLVWYWYHRLGHQINILWAAHIVHHQSEEFNLTVSARITTFQALIRSVFWCIIPFLGFHPTMVIVILTIHGTYSFFTHTRLIGKLGWLEHVLITPSLHGVHHASDELYLDKNFGDVFVFWDKLFGTLQKEIHQPTYGLTHPIKSHSFLWQHFHYYLELIAACRQVSGYRKKLMILFGHPALLDQHIRPTLEKKYFKHKKNNKYRFRFKTYLNIQLFISVIILTFTTAFYTYLTLPDLAFIAVFVLLTLINCGALMEQRRWIYDLECLRLILVFTYAFYKFNVLGYIYIPIIALLTLERTFSLRNLYRTYILKYDKMEA